MKSAPSNLLIMLVSIGFAVLLVGYLDSKTRAALSECVTCMNSYPEAHTITKGLAVGGAMLTIRAALQCVVKRWKDWKSA